MEVNNELTQGEEEEEPANDGIEEAGVIEGHRNPNNEIQDTPITNNETKQAK
ncbi:hypothetical protein JCM14467A_21520 [Vulcanisaeta sp. JCM 14467]